MVSAMEMRSLTEMLRPSSLMPNLTGTLPVLSSQFFQVGLQHHLDTHW